MKTLLVFNVDNVIDIITNSSSELFVLEGQTKEIVSEMITSIYPEYLSEYKEIKNIKDLSVEELEIYITSHCSPHMWPAIKSNYGLLPGFTFDEIYEPKRDFRTGEIEPPAWNGQIQYEIKDNSVRNLDDKWHFGSFVTEENKEDIIKKMNPNGTMFMMFSLDENPNSDMQEKLENIATRYHLG